MCVVFCYFKDKLFICVMQCYNIIMQMVSTHRNNIAYGIWCNMRQRCNNPNSKDYSRYGGRGIKIHPSWSKFLVFLKDVGERPSLSHTLDRIDNNGNYEPGNVRWATRQEQTHNSRVVKLDSQQVKNIRALYANRAGTQSFIAQKYNIHQSVVSRIVNGKIW